jgi:hypothetical protein
MVNIQPCSVTDRITKWWYRTTRHYTIQPYNSCSDGWAHLLSVTSLVHHPSFSTRFSLHTCNRKCWSYPISRYVLVPVYMAASMHSAERSPLLLNDPGWAVCPTTCIMCRGGTEDVSEGVGEWDSNSCCSTRKSVQKGPPM